MNLFNELLEKISKSLKNNELYKVQISEKISSIIGFKIKPDQIDIKKEKLFFYISPTIKSVILIKKEVLLKELSIYGIKTIL